MGKRNEVIEIMAKNEGVTISQLAQAINKPSANLYDIQSGKLKGVSNKLADALIDRFPQYSKSWLLTGEGSMLKSETHVVEGIELPLLPIDALAGALTGIDVSVMEYECERYIVPAFKDAKYLVRVSGDSMIPRYMSGDIVTCKPVVMDKMWFQWGKTYVISTVQGVLIKRIEPSKTEGCVLIRSYNPDYPPFDFPVSEINGVALVIGIIRTE